MAQGLAQPMNQQSAVVLGATGQIGVFVIPRLLSAGFRVFAVSRKPRPAWYPEFSKVQWFTPESIYSGCLSAADMLVSAGPIRVAAEVVEQSPKLKRAVIFSTSSVISKLESHDRGEKRQMREILKDEATLSLICENRGISLSVFRPTLIYGCGLDGNVSWLARWINRFGFMPVADGAEGLRQPVHADDLAQAAVTVLSADAPMALDVPLCGGSTLSFRDMVKKIFVGLGKPVRIVTVPGKLLAAVIYLGRLVPGLQQIRPEMVRRQGVDLVFDDTMAREFLGYSPRHFQPGPGEFSLPGSAGLRALAGLGAE